MKRSIFECVPGISCRPTGQANYGEPYVYEGFDRASGLHILSHGGKRGLFSRTKNEPPSWHIKRGAYCFEFVRSAK